MIADGYHKMGSSQSLDLGTDYPLDRDAEEEGCDRSVCSSKCNHDRLNCSGADRNDQTDFISNFEVGPRDSMTTAAERGTSRKVSG